MTVLVTGIAEHGTVLITADMALITALDIPAVVPCIIASADKYAVFPDLVGYRGHIFQPYQCSFPGPYGHTGIFYLLISKQSITYLLLTAVSIFVIIISEEERKCLILNSMMMNAVIAM